MFLLDMSSSTPQFIAFIQPYPLSLFLSRPLGDDVGEFADGEFFQYLLAAAGSADHDDLGAADRVDGADLDGVPHPLELEQHLRQMDVLG